MPDLDPLPRRPRPPVLAPRTGDLAEAVHRAKRRRRRHLGATASGAAGLALLVALTGGHPIGTSTLEPLPPATGGGYDTTTTPSPAPAAEPTPDPEDPAEPGGSGEPGQGDPEPGGEPAPEEPGDPDREDPADPRDEHAPLPAPPAARPVAVRDEVAHPGADCDSATTTLTADGWCLISDSPSVVRSGEVRQYRVLACRIVGRGAGVLGFRTEQEVEFAVIDSDRVYWSWSNDYPWPEAPHELRVPDGRCARWTVDWDTRGNDGRLLAPRQYSLNPMVEAASWGGVLDGAYGMAYGLEIVP
jgi:hypothetical protein